MKIFVSYWFRPENAWVPTHVIPLMRCFGHVPITGQLLDAGPVSDDVRLLIRSCRVPSASSRGTGSSTARAANRWAGHHRTGSGTSSGWPAAPANPPSSSRKRASRMAAHRRSIPDTISSAATRPGSCCASRSCCPGGRSDRCNLGWPCPLPSAIGSGTRQTATALRHGGGAVPPRRLANRPSAGLTV
jgi:hypothetical protein